MKIFKDLVLNPHPLYNKIKVMNMIEDLKAVIGKDVSENRSPTLRAKLIKVNKTTCTFEVVQSPYRIGDEDKIGMKYRIPISYSWNAFFF
jgi:hypothetical protein